MIAACPRSNPSYRVEERSVGDDEKKADHRRGVVGRLAIVRNDRETGTRDIRPDRDRNTGDLRDHRAANPGRRASHKVDPGGDTGANLDLRLGSGRDLAIAGIRDTRK